MSVYPTGIDSFTTKVDNVDDVMAVDVNGLQDSIVAIETVLGTGVSNFLAKTGGDLTGNLGMASGVQVIADYAFEAIANLNGIVVDPNGIQLNDNIDNKLMHINQYGITLADNAPNGEYLYLRDGSVDVEGNNGMNIVAVTGSITLKTTQQINTSGAIVPFSSGTDNLGSADKPFGTLYVSSIDGLAADYVNITGDTMTGPLAIQSTLQVGNVIANVAIPNSLSTGLLLGGNVTLNGASGINIASGNGRVVNSYTDPNNPIITPVSWGNFTNVTLDYVASAARTYIGITSSGTVFQQPTSDFTPYQKRDYITLARIAHPNGSGTGVVGHAISSFDGLLNSVDFQEVVGPLNLNGNVFSPSGTSMKIQKSAGNIYSIGTNFQTDRANPNTIANPAIAPVQFQYRYRNNASGSSFTTLPLTTDIVANTYDNGTGTPSATLGNNDFTAQRIYYVFGSNRVIIMYGQNVYNSIAKAEAALFSETFVADNDLAAVTAFRGWLIVEGNTTNLSVTTKAKFVSAGLFGLASPAGATSATTDLQTAYNNSSTPEILTDATRDGLTMKEGPNVGLSLYEGQDQNGATVFSVSASGNVAISGITTFSNTVLPYASGTVNVGNSSTPFSGVYANQYATTLYSQTGGNITIDWNQGTSQIVNFNGVVSGTYTVSFSNALPGSAYVLKTIQNGTGTAAIMWSGTQTIWQGGVSGTMTASAGATDLFSLWYDGSKYLGSYSNNFY